MQFAVACTLYLIIWENNIYLFFVLFGFVFKFDRVSLFSL